MLTMFNNSKLSLRTIQNNVIPSKRNKHKQTNKQKQDKKIKNKTKQNKKSIPETDQRHELQRA